MFVSIAFIFLYYLKNAKMPARIDPKIKILTYLHKSSIIVLLTLFVGPKPDGLG